MARCPELVFQAMPGSEAAQAEALEMVRSHLGLPSPAVESSAPLDAAARMVEEDLCLLQLTDGEYRLTAASVASPSYWRLADKLGKELLDIHNPVPELRTRIGARMRQFFHKLPAGRIFMRGNWFIHASDRLFRLPEHLCPPRAGEPLALGALVPPLRTADATAAAGIRCSAVHDPRLSRSPRRARGTSDLGRGSARSAAERRMGGRHENAGGAGLARTSAGLAGLVSAEGWS